MISVFGRRNGRRNECFFVSNFCCFGTCFCVTVFYTVDFYYLLNSSDLRNTFSGIFVWNLKMNWRFNRIISQKNEWKCFWMVNKFYLVEIYCSIWRNLLCAFHLLFLSFFTVYALVLVALNGFVFSGKNVCLELILWRQNYSDWRNVLNVSYFSAKLFTFWRKWIRLIVFWMV